MDRTDSRLAPSPGTASDDAASPINSPAHDNQDLLGFEPVPLRCRTDGPPPDGFEGEEQGVWNGVDWYCRTLTPAEQSAIEARDAEEISKDRALEADRRDRFFGFAGDGISSPREAETIETSEPSEEEEEPGEGPIEYKSLTPPCRHPGASRDLGETRRDFSTPGPGFRRDDGQAHIQTAPPRHPC